MTLVDNLTDAADQTTTLILPDNTAATLRLRFRPRTGRWVADVGYAATGFQANGINVCCLPNILRAWRRTLPFGIAFMTADFTDPFQLTDFLTGRCSVYLLNEEDVASVEETVIGRPS
jgi:hypothetical protein